MSDVEREVLYDIWQQNMINCCQFELQFAPIDYNRVLVQIPDGKHVLEFGKMLRKDEKCHSFVIDGFEFLCRGHPEWDPKKPGKYIREDDVKVEL